MALSKQFYSSFKSYNGWDYYLEIWVEGYSGSASEISIGAGGPVITYGTDEQDRFSPILSSKLELPFMVTNTTQDAFIKNIRENFNEQDVYIHLYRASSSDYSSVAPLWSGFVLMDLSASPDLYYPYPVKLTAVDGLALLKDIDFVKSGSAGSYVGSDMYTTTSRFTYWIKEILLKSGASTTDEGSTQDYKFTTAINWFNSVMPTITQSTDPLYQTKCSTKMFFSKDADANFTVVNCYDVLKNLLKHWGARIIYWKHIYYIVQIQEYNTAESGTYANPDNIDTRTYTKTGAFDGSSDNLGDSYWTRYNLLIDDVTGGIQKLTGTQFNYLPQLKRTQANFIDYGNKNYFGGLPFNITTAQTDVIKQATISNPSADGTMLLIIPLDITLVQQYVGSLALGIKFRLYITDGSTTYYLRYDSSNNPKYYWEDSTTANLNFNITRWGSVLDNIVGTQTKVGFNQQIEFKDVNGSALTLNGDWDVFTDIDNWGTFGGSFHFIHNYISPFAYSSIYEPSSTTIYYTNTLNPTYQNPLNLSIIGTTTQPNNGPYGTAGVTQNNIISYTTSLNQNPFEGKLLIVNTSASGALYGSFVSVSPSTPTNDSQIIDFGDLIWGDTLLASSEGCLNVWNGSSFVKSDVIGAWGLGSTSGTNSFTEMLLSEYLYGQTKVIESPSMKLVIGETNKNQNDGSGSRPNYVNPIGRLKGYSATGTTPYYIFKSGSFHLLKDEIDYQGYQIIRDTQTLTKTDDIIIGPDILQDKTNIIGQKGLQTDNLSYKLVQNSYITTTSALKSAYGNDIAVNGIFASDTGWTKGTGWSIASNKASFSPTGSASDIKQDALTNALTYKIVVSLTLSAGALSVKAGSSGNATVLSASGTYEIFSTCAGSTEVIFEASAAFEGYIEKVVVQQQVPVTSISINAIGEAVFKTNDVLNIADVDGSDVNQFTVSADQGASDTSISVTSKLISEDILEGSIILVNQNDLAAQYQNKTKGTVGGFDITATSIDSGSVAISSYIDDDSFATASATSLATSESIKAYVDGQAGHSETLQGVTDNGNTTTNSINIGSSTAPAKKLTVTTSATGDGILGISTDGYTWCRLLNDNSTTTPVGTLRLYYGTSQSVKLTALSNQMKLGDSQNTMTFFTASSERMRLTTTGLGIGTSSPSEILNLAGNNPNIRIDDTSAASRSELNSDISWYDSTGAQGSYIGHFQSANLEIRSTAGDVSIGTFAGTQIYIDGANTGIGTLSPTEKLHVVGDALITGDSHADAFKPAVSGNPIKFKNFDSSTEFARITNAGNLLLGTTTDSGEKLVVNGDIKINDNTIKIGINNDLLIYHDGSNSYIKEVGTGTLRLQTDGTGIDFYKNSTEFLARLITDGAVELYYDSVKKFETTSSGISITGGGIFTDQVTIPATPVASTDAASKGYVDAQIGANNDLQEITDNGATTTNDMTISNGAPSMILKDSTSSSSSMLTRVSYRDNTDTEIGVVGFFNDSNLRLRNFLSSNITFWTSSSEKMRLTSGGNLLLGTTTDDGSNKLQVNGNIKVGDNDELIFGDSNDFKIYHYNSEQWLDNSTGDWNFRQIGVGNMIFQNLSDNKDIIFQSDNGTGGITTYLELDGSQTTVNFYKTVLIGTTTNTGAYKIDVAGKQRVQDTLELDEVLMLNAISTPSDPAAGKSVIYMDSSDGGIKCKINVGGTVVTRTIASFE